MNKISILERFAADTLQAPATITGGSSCRGKSKSSKSKSSKSKSSKSKSGSGSGSSKSRSGGGCYNPCSMPNKW